MRRAGVVLIVGFVTLVSCAGGISAPQISDARVGRPAGPNAAMYFTASGGGRADRLIGASTDAADSVEMHETTTSGTGTIGMQEVDFLELPADGALVLEPGGYHLMLVGADAVEVGEEIEVTLTWEVAGAMSLDVEVVDPSDTMGNDG